MEINERRSHIYNKKSLKLRRRDSQKEKNASLSAARASRKIRTDASCGDAEVSASPCVDYNWMDVSAFFCRAAIRFFVYKRAHNARALYSQNQFLSRAITCDGD
jgi:hypothetical protein